MSTRDEPIPGHLTGRDVQSPPVAVYSGSEVSEHISRFWVPVWDFTSAQPQVQRTLQSAACLVVIAHNYQRFYGITRGMSTVELAGRGWAVGAVLRPTTGWLLWQGTMGDVIDRHVDIAEVAGLAEISADLVDRVHSAMGPDPHDRDAHQVAQVALAEALSTVPIDDDGALLNRAVADAEGMHGQITVQQLACRHSVSERSLQRLVQQRLGVSPKWLLQRARIVRASEVLKSDDVGLADAAVACGYSDQAHFTNDFRAITGMTPGAYLQLQR